MAGRGGVPQSASLLASQGGGRVPERTALLLLQLHRTNPLAAAQPSLRLVARPTSLRAGPGTQPQTCPQVASRDKDGEGAHPIQGPTFPL